MNSQSTNRDQFIQLAQSVNALKFGEFTLKSGRISPYFFNAGAFCTGEALWRLADCYAEKIIADNLQFDVLFGPAYKGIPLVAALSVVLAQKTGQSIPWAFNRKEAKDHGEGGLLVGSELRGRVLIIDDVMTAGTAIKEVFSLLENFPQAEVMGVLVALDRQEQTAHSNQSAVQQVAAAYQIDVHAIIALADLMAYVKADPQLQIYQTALEAYRKQYGVTL